MKISIAQSFLFFLFYISLNSYGTSIEVTGLVSGTWNTDTVKVIGNIEIREAETLIIEPGVFIEFQGEYHFKVNGCLKSIGISESPIIFTMADTTGFHNDTIPNGGWKSIRIKNLSPTIDSTIFDYCHFSYGKAVSADSIHSYGGAICARNTNKIRISNCTFQNNYCYYNGGAVFLEQSNALIEHNTFTSNNAGVGWGYYGYGGGLCTDSGEPMIRKNTFFKNSSTGIAGGLCVRFTDCPVLLNIFDNNFSALGGGFGILHIDTCHHIIANNLIINNGATYFGAGISNNDCSPTYINNTIANNHCIGAGGGFYCKDSVVPNLFNNIIVGNTQYGGESNQVRLMDLLCQPNFYYNNIMGGKESFTGEGGVAFSGDYQNNIDADPKFENPGTNDFALKYDSPCIDTGTPDTSGLGLPPNDLAGNARIFRERIDMGAYESHSALSVEIPLAANDLVLFPPSPNPSSTFVKLSFYLRQKSEVKLKILDANGRSVKSLISRQYPPGKHHFNWNLTSDNAVKLTAGIYMVQLQADKKLYHQKIIIE